MKRIVIVLALALTAACSQTVVRPEAKKDTDLWAGGWQENAPVTGAGVGAWSGIRPQMDATDPAGGGTGCHWQQWPVKVNGALTWTWACSWY